MINNLEQAKKFDNWIRKVGNIHYSNNKRMLAAYQRIEPLTADRAIIDFKIERSRFKLSLFI